MGAQVGDPPGFAFQKGIRVAAGDVIRVELKVPAGKPITFEVDDPRAVVDRSSAGDYWIRLHAAGMREPGRDQLPDFDTWLHVLGPGPMETAPLPVGRHYHVECSVEPNFGNAVIVRDWPRVKIVPDRQTAEAGDTVHLRAAPVAWLRIHLASTPSGLLNRAGLRCVLRFVDGAYRKEWKDWRAIDTTSPILVPVAPGAAELSWSGGDVISGRIQNLDLEEGRVSDAKVVFDPARGTAAPAPRKLHVTVEPSAKSATAGVPVFAAGGGGPFEQVVYGQSASLPARWRTARYLVAGRGSALATQPVPVPASGSLTLRLEPAGEIVVVPFSELSNRLWDLLIWRKDGKPFLAAEGDVFVMGASNGYGVATKVVVRAGTIIGPLPAGTYTFSVSLGGVPLPDATSTVEAGRLSVLKITR